MTDLAERASRDIASEDRRARRNLIVLAAAGALGNSAPPINFSVAAIAAYDLLGKDKSLATLPITAFVVGTACGTVPAALLMRRVGRKPGFVTGMLISTLGALVAADALIQASFLLLCGGSFLIGFAAAFVQQFRFAAAETGGPAFRARAMSLVMASGVVAAVLGPQTVIHTADFLKDPPFAGAFLGSAALTLLGAMVLLLLDIPHMPPRAGAPTGWPIGRIARRPEFLVAVGCAMSAYAVMSFVMTAAPLAMVMHHHHQNAAVLGIQWHVLAMYVPSFFTGSLIARYGAPPVVATGLILLLGCSLTALAGSTVGHFWLALVLLGVGWNFAFVGGTALVSETYRPAEKAKVQALNDFIIFGVVALASFSSGEILMVGGWNALNLVVVPVALASLVAVLWQMRRRTRPI